MNDLISDIADVVLRLNDERIFPDTIEAQREAFRQIATSLLVLMVPREELLADLAAIEV